MSKKIILKAGTPDDDNRTYLPESILHSDIVVNENGNNSIPYNENLQVFTEDIQGIGEPDTWYEYVPESYDGTKAVPLVIGLHGGLMTGWGHSIYTSWVPASEKGGFICLFPNAHKARMWAVEGIFPVESEPDLPVQVAADSIKDNKDANMILKLIDRMKQKYRIDSGRIFMQGMSMGNLMTSQFVRYYKDLIAGAAGSGGPTQLHVLYNPDGTCKHNPGPLAIWQSRPEVNGIAPGASYNEFEINKFNRFYWMKINECDPIPEISIVGEDNLAFYKGKKADLVYLDIKNRDHGQTLDEAFLYWDYLFSGVRRNDDGTITCGEGNIPRKGDALAAAFTAGAPAAWMNNKVCTLSQPAVKWQKLKYHGLNGGQKVRGEYLMVPAAFLAEFAGAEYMPSGDTLTAEMKLADGRVLQFARGSIGCMIDDTMRSMYCEALHRNGELLISAEWFCSYILNLQVSCCNDVIYVTDHMADLSMFMADLIKDLLNGKADPACWDVRTVL